LFQRAPNDFFTAPASKLKVDWIVTVDVRRIDEIDPTLNSMVYNGSGFFLVRAPSKNS